MTKSEGTDETALTVIMRREAKAIYGSRLVVTKYHGGEFSEVGVSDFLGVLDSIMFACEVKHTANYGGSVERALSQGPTLKQRLYLRRVHRAGGVATVAATVDQFLETLQRCVDRQIGWHDFRANPRGVMDK